MPLTVPMIRHYNMHDKPSLLSYCDELENMRHDFQVMLGRGGKMEEKKIDWQAVGARIRGIREGAGVSQAKLFIIARGGKIEDYAKGTPQSTVSYWEKGERPNGNACHPTLEELIKIADYGGMSLDRLLFDRDENEKMAQFLNTNAETLQGLCVALWKFRDALKMSASISTAADGAQTFNISIPLVPNTRVRQAFTRHAVKYAALLSALDAAREKAADAREKGDAAKESEAAGMAGAFSSSIEDALHNIPDLFPRSLSPETERYIDKATPEQLMIIDRVFASLDSSIHQCEGYIADELHQIAMIAEFPITDKEGHIARCKELIKEYQNEIDYYNRVKEKEAQLILATSEQEKEELRREKSALIDVHDAKLLQKT